MLAILEPRANLPVKTPPGQPPEVTGPAAVEAVAQSAVDATLRHGADRKIADPYLIGLLLFQDPYEVFHRETSNLRQIVSDRLRIMRGLAGTHYYDGNALLGLAEADLALADMEARGSWAKARRARINQN